MSEQNVYEAPASNIETEQSNKPSAIVILFAIIFSAILAGIMFIKQSAAMGVVGGLGGMVGSLIPAAIIVGLFQISKRLRNSRSRWKIFMWTQFVFVLGQVAGLLRYLAAA